MNNDRFDHSTTAAAAVTSASTSDSTSFSMAVAFPTAVHSYLMNSYGTILLFDDIAPNIGLWWYFFIQIFPRFYNGFRLIFHLLPIALTAFISYRFNTLPFVAFTLTFSVYTLYKPYATIADFSTMHCLSLTIFPYYKSYMNNQFFTLMLAAISATLGTLFFYLWIVPGSGNSNFYYFQTLIWNLAHCMFLSNIGRAVRARQVFLKYGELQ
jgi:phosphatidylinositol glycan class U